MKKNTYIYPAVFTYYDNGIAVTFPDIELATQGDDELDALEMAKYALGGRLWLMERDGDEIPNPSTLQDIKLEDSQKALFVEVFMPSVRMAKVNKAVTRTVTIPAWLSAEANKHKVNFSKILQDGLIQHLGIEDRPVL